MHEQACKVSIWLVFQSPFELLPLRVMLELATKCNEGIRNTHLGRGSHPDTLYVVDCVGGWLLRTMVHLLKDKALYSMYLDILNMKLAAVRFLHNLSCHFPFVSLCMCPVAAWRWHAVAQ